MKKASASEWAERVRAWHESGQSSAEFAQSQDYSEKALRWWSGEFKRRSRPKPTVKMARVVRREELGQVEVTVAVAGASIGVRRGFDAELLRQVVQALTGAR